MDNYLQSDNIIEEKVKIGEVPGIVFRPKDREGLLPTIIFYHGWSSNKESQRFRGFILATLGYQVLLPDALYHGEREIIDYNNPINAGKLFWPIILNSLEESREIVDYMVNYHKADPNRIGVAGHSMGGITAAGVFTHNEDLNTLVVFNGSCNWMDSNKYFMELLQMDMKVDNELEEKIEKLDPMNNLHKLINRPILILHGGGDEVVSIEPQRRFYKEILLRYNNTETVGFMEQPNLNHFITTNMMEEAVSWFKKYL